MVTKSFLQWQPGGIARFIQRWPDLVYAFRGVTAICLIDIWAKMALAALPISAGGDDRESLSPESGLAQMGPELQFRASLGTSGGQISIGAFDRFNVFNPASINGRSALLPSTQRGALDVKPSDDRTRAWLQRQLPVGSTSPRIYLVRPADRGFAAAVRTTAPSTGYLSQLGNFGSLDNTGIEILLKAVPINNSNMQWTSTVTFAANKNEINGIEGGVIIIPESFGQVAAINGEPLGVFYSDA
ncbi:MAG: hypothetical protein U5J63_14725 [Fodinibius sp.]|nr:hypothetical protein [Fodinibius sp.]